MDVADYIKGYREMWDSDETEDDEPLRHLDCIGKLRRIPEGIRDGAGDELSFRDFRKEFRHGGVSDGVGLEGDVREILLFLAMSGRIGRGIGKEFKPEGICGAWSWISVEARALPDLDHVALLGILIGRIFQGPAM